MSTPSKPMRLDQNDLYTPQVEAYLEQQDMIRRAMPEMDRPPLVLRILYSSYFYLALTSGLGAFVAWLILEPFFDDNDMGNKEHIWINLLMFPTVVGFVGLFLGASEGIMCRNLRRAVISAAVGLGVGFGGGLVSLIGATIVFTLMNVAAAALMKGPPPPGRMPTGLPLLIFIMGRASAWAFAAIPAGLGQGIALRERKVLLNGLLGAVLGGLIGGLLFDPIAMVFTGADGQANISRGVGFTFIGIMVGLLVGVVEQWTKTAWLLMQAGPLAGKQFVLHRNPTVLGSSPKADIYLFKDEAIEPRHALIHNRGGRYEIEDLGTPDGTYVNGLPVHKQILQQGDKIVLGKTVLEFSLRETTREV
jgi:hypothetical protein